MERLKYISLVAELRQIAAAKPQSICLRPVDACSQKAPEEINEFKNELVNNRTRDKHGLQRCAPCFYPRISFASELIESMSMGSKIISSGSKSNRNCI